MQPFVAILSVAARLAPENPHPQGCRDPLQCGPCQRVARLSDIVQEPDPSDPSDPNRLLNAALDALGCPPEERARAERELLFAAEVYHATQRAPEELAPSTA